jgi:dUTPase
MPTTIKLKNSVTTTNAPSSLAQGEVAINVTDKKVWVGNAATTPVQLLGTGASATFTDLTVVNGASIQGLTVGRGAGAVSTNTGFYMYPRSSLSKTNLRLANSVGIIDSGYRGNLIGAFDCLPVSVPSHNAALGNSNLSEYCVEKYKKLTQICAPGLVPIIVEIVNSIEDLGNETIRGGGGFGSTGR